MEKYPMTGQEAEQDFLTDFWRNNGEIATLPRKYNCHVLELRDQSTIGGQCWEGSMVDVGVHVKRIASDLRKTLESKAELYSATWEHFSADPKPVDMVCEERQSRTDTSLLRGNVVGRYVLEALMCGAHLNFIQQHGLHFRYWRKPSPRKSPLTDPNESRARRASLDDVC